jgi:Leu/Phe-tRNA-protein transferase
VEIFDVQMTTPHLASLGAEEWPRRKYLRHVARLRRRRVDLAGLVVSA